MVGIAVLLVNSCDLNDNQQESDNRPPRIIALTSTNHIAYTGGASGSMLICTASDPDGDSLTYTWTATGGEFSEYWTDHAVLWLAPDQVGDAVITVHVSDGEAVVSESDTIYVSDYIHYPDIYLLEADPDTVQINGTSTLTVEAYDYDGDSLTYRWRAFAGTLTTDVGKTTIWTAPASTGYHPVGVYVSDGTHESSRVLNIYVVDSAQTVQ